MKILIVDDEPLARERLERLAQDIHEEVTIEQAEHGLDALEKMNANPAEIVLLDIRMPVMDGMETAHHLTRLDPEPAIIFTTAYEEHALQAFEAQAIDYLLKPVKRERLRIALERATRLHSGSLEKVREADSGLPRSHLSATYKGGLRLVATDDVRYFRAEQKYVSACWPDGELILDESLLALEEEFGDRFIRIHRNTLVARHYIDRLDKDDEGQFYLTLKDMDERLPISRRNVSHIRKILKDLP